MLRRRHVFSCSPRALAASVAVLTLALGCSSDEGSGSEGGAPPYGTAPVPGNQANPGDMGSTTPPAPANTDPGASPADPDMPASGNGNEGNAPIDTLDPGTAPTDPGSGGTAQPPAENPPAENPPAENPPAENPPAENPPEQPGPVAVFAEDTGLDCTLGQLPNNIPGNARLPNPFTKLDGTQVASQADWRCRRKELRAMAERYVYGPKPIPQNVTGSVTNNQITVNVSDQGRSVMFQASIRLPDTGSAPFPAVFDTSGTDANMFLSQGVAIISFIAGAQNPVAQESSNSGSQQNRQNKRGAFYTLYGANSQTGFLGAWAWGVSRMIDVIADSDGSVINKDALAVMGCSRSGKAAFAIGALDERIALTVPFESGTAGVPAYRAIAQAEVGNNNRPSQSLLGDPNGGFGEQAWFGDVFQPFTTAANTTPIDTHEIIGMIAPRGLLILDNPFIGELTPRGAHAAALGGVEVFKALGVEANFGYLSNTNDGMHCLIRPEYQEPLRQAIQKHLFKNPNATGGAITTSQTFATANRADWIDWQTPSLQ